MLPQEKYNYSQDITDVPKFSNTGKYFESFRNNVFEKEKYHNK